MNAQPQAIEVRKEQGIQEWKSPHQIKARITAIQQLMETTLKQDVDYGVIPGMPKGTKPSLWKPGSEQILAMFQIAVEPIVEDLCGEDCYRYRVTARLTNAITGDFLGAGIGEASTDETKYKWRRTYVQKEFDNTPEDRRRIKYKSYEGKESEEMQVRQEPADLANTILKMAKKRAQIDATLTVTGASSMFEQDLEDLTDETREEMTRQRTPRGKKAPPKEVGDVKCADCGAINGHLPHCKYKKPQESQPEEKKPITSKWLVQVEAVDLRKKTGKNEKGEEFTREYLLLSCLNAASENVTVYSWDKKHWERIQAIPAHSRCIFVVKPQVAGTQTYWNIIEIVEITGEAKQQGKMSDDQGPVPEENF